MLFHPPARTQVPPPGDAAPPVTRARLGWRQAASALTAALALATLAAGCAGQTPPVTQTSANDRANLTAAVTALADDAAACVSASPPGWSADGLALLASWAPEWADALGEPTAPSPASGSSANSTGALAESAAPSPATGSASPASAAANPAGAGDASGAPGSGSGQDATAAGQGTCRSEDLQRDLARVEALSLRLAEETGADPVFLAIARAAAVAEAIGRDSLAELAEPDCADLADLVPETLDALALAEDQAGFLGEYLAAFFEAGSAERQAIAAAAAAHRLRAESLVTLSDSPDPRAVAYALGAPPADAAAASARWATVELTLARHYAQIGLELGGGAEPTIRWQLVQAHRWGAELPALP